MFIKEYSVNLLKMSSLLHSKDKNNHSISYYKVRPSWNVNLHTNTNNIILLYTLYNICLTNLKKFKNRLGVI